LNGIAPTMMPVAFVTVINALVFPFAGVVF
jgi:hypothetical protein